MSDDYAGYGEILEQKDERIRELEEQLESERAARSEALNDMQVIIDLAQPNVERHTAFVHIARIARFYREAWEGESNPAREPS